MLALIKTESTDLTKLGNTNKDTASEDQEIFEETVKGEESMWEEYKQKVNVFCFRENG